MEGRVYNCTWTKERESYRVWVKSNPDLSAEGASLSDADERLWSKICERFGDGENCRDYDPPFPRAADTERYFANELVTLIGNTRAEKVGPLKDLFSEGVCPACGSGLGNRTETPLSVGFIESGYDSAFFSLGATGFSLYSEDFVELLGHSETAGFDWRIVHRGKRARKNFYELASQCIRPWVAKRGWELSGWQCERCGQRVFGHWGKECAFTRAISSKSVPHASLIDYEVGSRSGAEVCVRRSKWREMAGKLGAKGIVAQDLAVLPVEESNENPELPTRNLAREGYLVGS